MKYIKLYFLALCVIVFPLDVISDSLNNKINDQEFRKVVTENVVKQLISSQCNEESELIKKFKLSKEQCTNGLKYAGFLCIHNQTDVRYNHSDKKNDIINKGALVSKCIVKYFFSGVRYDAQFK